MIFSSRRMQHKIILQYGSNDKMQPSLTSAEETFHDQGELN